MSISPKTEVIYATKFEQLRRQTAKACGARIETSVSPIQIVEFLIKRKPELAKRSWRLYKAALMHQFLLEREQAPDQATQQEYDYALQILGEETQEGAMTHGTRTSALKAKSLSNDDFDKLLAHIIANRNKHCRARALLVWCIATAPVGLRPSEWNHTWLETDDEGTRLLRVGNGKSTNGRGNGAVRTLNLTACTETQLDAIGELLDLLEGYRQDGDDPDKAAQTFQNRIAKYLSRVARQALSRRKKYPSLYTFRHQFSANAKSHLNHQEVAALMGHASDATASRNYSQSRLATGKVSVRPAKSEVETVRRRVSTWRKPRSPTLSG